MKDTMPTGDSLGALAVSDPVTFTTSPVKRMMNGNVLLKKIHKKKTITEGFEGITGHNDNYERGEIISTSTPLVDIGEIVEYDKHRSHIMDTEQGPFTVCNVVHIISVI